MNWENICKKHQLDSDFLKEFTPKGNVRLMQEEEFDTTQEWLSAYALGAELLPIFTNNESDFVAVYTTGLLKGKVALVIHDALDFTPVFSNIQSFLKVRPCLLQMLHHHNEHVYLLYINLLFLINNLTHHK